MNAVEFTTQLTERPVLTIPKDIAAQLPKTGLAKVIVLTGDASADTEWRRGAYEQFMKDDAPEDSVYDNLK